VVQTEQLMLLPLFQILQINHGGLDLGVGVHLQENPEALTANHHST